MKAGTFAAILAVAAAITFAMTTLIPDRGNRTTFAKIHNNADEPPPSVKLDEMPAQKARTSNHSTSASSLPKSSATNPAVPGSKTSLTAADGAVPANTASHPLASRSEEHQKLSKSLADSYISGMYSEEKLSEPIPEMAALMHHKYRSESADPDWRGPAEMALNNYLASSLGDLGDAIDMADVGCRATICELVAVIQRNANLDENMLMDRWNRMGVQMRNQPWWNQYSLGQPQFEMASGPNGSMLLFMYLLRQPSG